MSVIDHGVVDAVPHPQEQPEPPRPAALQHLRASNRVGFVYAFVAVSTTAAALVLASSSQLLPWLAGNVLLALALLQWFALLHECGHETLFRTRRLHAPLGHAAAFFTMIPFHNWRRVHGRHHKWTGWQDVDPTTAALVPRELGRAERLLVNIAWRTWLPVFSVLYRLNNFWNLPRVFGLFPNARDRRLMTLHAAMLLGVYSALVWTVGPLELLRMVGLGLFLSLVVEDLLLLSQHTHIPQEHSGGEAVRPFPTIEQEVFTRSLKLPAWASAWLVNFDAHELHHMYPFLPGYRLSGIEYDTENEIGWWRWLRGAKRLPGEVFLFQNRHESGADI